MNAQVQSIKVRVNRPFIYEGKRREVGEELSAPVALAAELFTAHKAERSDREPTAAHTLAKAEAQAKAKPAQAVRA